MTQQSRVVAEKVFHDLNVLASHLVIINFLPLPLTHQTHQLHFLKSLLKYRQPIQV